jgi:hypothetical protein
MDNLSFGITMLMCGMGGTLLTLGLFSFLMYVLTMIFPYKADDGAKKAE